MQSPLTRQRIRAGLGHAASYAARRTTRLAHAALMALYPPLCLLCARECGSLDNLCDDCRDTLPSLGPRCRVCAEPSTRPVCNRCTVHERPFQRTIAAAPYQPPIRQWIHTTKFNRPGPECLTLGRLLAGTVLQAYPNGLLPDAIVPVPLSARRLFARGYNQAALIAAPVARVTRIPIRVDIARRSRHTRPQAGLSQHARHENLQRAFSIRRDCSGLWLAVVDDVITTLATATALAQALQSAGATRIDLWCAARA